MDLRIAICDDSDSDRSRLQHEVDLVLSALKVNCTFAVFSSAEEMLQDFSADTYDLAFLDIRMGEMDGIHLAANLHNADPALPIIYVTTMRDYALEAYPTHPFDFLVKPWERKRLAKVLVDVVRLISEEEIPVSITVPYGSVQILPSQLMYVEAHDHAIVFSLENGSSIRSTLRFSEAEELLANRDSFLVVNRGVIVNMSFVQGIDGTSVTMADGSSFPLRKRDRAVLKKAITQHMISHMGDKRG